MATYAALFPPGKMNELAAFADLMTWAKLKPESWVRITAAFGEEVDDIETVATVPNKDYLETLQALQPPLGAIQKARLSMFVNAARAKLGLAVSEISRLRQPWHTKTTSGKRRLLHRHWPVRYRGHTARRASILGTRR